jgi:hypothetical protein
MGLNYINEVRQTQQLVDRVADTINIRHHMVGIMAQETGYYVDIAAYYGSPMSISGVVADRDATFKTAMVSGSALEHGILEQLMGISNPGVSTMKLFQINNANGNKFFSANSSNFGTPGSTDPTHIRNRINYAAEDLGTLQGIIDSGQTVILPENGFLNSGQWQGSGYIRKNADGALGFTIRGNLNGGYSSNAGIVEAPTVNEVIITHSTNKLTPESIISHPTQIPTPVSKDPVDMAGGAFLHDHTDLAIGGAPPRGLAFARIYNSGRNQADIGLGYGWTHNYHIRLNKTSNAGPVLGS